jgi:hypothetical protein
MILWDSARFLPALGDFNVAFNLGRSACVATETEKIQSLAH